AASAGTLNWYNTSTDTMVINTGTSLTTPTISSTMPFYVEATNNGCASTRSMVVATIKPVPVISSTTGAQTCSSGSLVLSAVSTGSTLNWYAAATGGSSVGTGTTYITPTLSSTTPYYVDATKSGCTSTRTRVDAVINPLPTVSITNLNDV